MKRLFIDIVGMEDKRLDFIGQLFPCIEQAGEAAQVVSIDLAIADNSPWIGAEVQVKDEQGRCLLRYPIRQLQ